MSEVTEKAKKTDKPEVNKGDVSPATASLAEVFAKQMKLPKDSNRIEIEGNLVEDNLPANLTMADIKRVDAYRNQVATAATLALGKVGLSAMKKQKDLATVDLSFKFNSDPVELTLHREKEFSGGPSGEKTVKYGYVQRSYTVKGAANSGEMKKALTSIGNEAAAMFGGK